MTHLPSKSLVAVADTALLSSAKATHRTPTSTSTSATTVRREVERLCDDATTTSGARAARIGMTNALREYSALKDEASIRAIVQLLGNRPNVGYDIILHGALMNAWASLGEMERVAELFQRTKQLTKAEPNEVCYSILLKTLVGANRTEEAVRLFREAQTRLASPSQVMYAILIKHLIDLKHISLAWELFWEMEDRNITADVVTYSLMIHACTKASETEKAFRLLNDMTSRGLTPTTITFTTLLAACSTRFEYYLDGFRIMRQMTMDFGYKPTLTSYNTLMLGCGFAGDVVNAEFLFRSVFSPPSAASSGEFVPSIDTYVALLEAYSRAPIFKSRLEQNIIPKENSFLTFDRLPVPWTLPDFDVIQRAKEIFAIMEANPTVLLLPKKDLVLFTYFVVFVNHCRTEDVLHVMNVVFPRYRAAISDEMLFKIIIMCATTRDADLALRTWRQIQDLQAKPTIIVCHHMLATLAYCNEIDKAFAVVEETERLGYVLENTGGIAALLKVLLAGYRKQDAKHLEQMIADSQRRKEQLSQRTVATAATTVRSESESESESANH